MKEPNKFQILETYPDMTFLFADGFDAAIIGVYDDKIVYSVDKAIAVLQLEGMEEGEAIEYFYFNVAGAYVGEQTPIWVEDSYLIS